MEKLAMKQYAQNIAKVMRTAEFLYYSTNNKDNDYNTVTVYQLYYHIKYNYIMFN